jgi:hypothetical protein
MDGHPTSGRFGKLGITSGVPEALAESECPSPISGKKQQPTGGEEGGRGVNETRKTKAKGMTLTGMTLTNQARLP